MKNKKRKRFYIYNNQYIIVFTHKNVNRKISLYEHINRVHYINIGSLKTKYQKKYCYICGCELTRQNRTKDHIPQKCLYEGCSNNKKKNLLTIYCCSECNTKLSSKEQELRNLLGITAEYGKQKKRIVKSSVKDLTLEKNYNRLFHRDGKIIGVQFTKEDLNESAIKALKGIILVLYNVLITSKFNITVYSPNFDQSILDKMRISPEIILQYEKWYKSGSERIFRFKITCLDKNLNAVNRSNATIDKIQYIIAKLIYWEEIMFYVIANKI